MQVLQFVILVTLRNIERVIDSFCDRLSLDDFIDLQACFVSDSNHEETNAMSIVPKRVNTVVAKNDVSPRRIHPLTFDSNLLLKILSA